jgi:hypothetical protein
MLTMFIPFKNEIGWKFLGKDGLEREGIGPTHPYNRLSGRISNFKMGLSY